MVAFAANSLLNRLAIVDTGMSAFDFGVIRLFAGAVALLAIVLWQRQSVVIGGWRRSVPVAALLLYIFGFSFAYQSLDAGVGALILFGVVQISMFLAAFLRAEAMPRRRLLGAALAFVGLIWLLWPGADVALPGIEVLAMALAGFGWGVYSLLGQGERDATQATALNFLFASLFASGVWLSFTTPQDDMRLAGVSLAILSGALTSGLGYALWYAVLPSLGASRAAVAQLTVPVIATAGGVLFLAEGVTMRFVISALLVLGGVWISIKKG